MCILQGVEYFNHYGILVLWHLKCLWVGPLDPMRGSYLTMATTMWIYMTLKIYVMDPNRYIILYIFGATAENYCSKQ